MKNVTRKDIAEKLGVSVSVVSRVINNSGYVSKGLIVIQDSIPAILDKCKS